MTTQQWQHDFNVLCKSWLNKIDLHGSVVDRHRFDADPDPNLHLDANPDPDWHQNNANPHTCWKSGF